MSKKYIVIEALGDMNIHDERLESFIAKFLKYDIKDRYDCDISCESDRIYLINDITVESFIDYMSSTLQSLTVSGAYTLSSKNEHYSMAIKVFGWNAESESGAYKRFELVNSNEEHELDTDYMIAYSYSEDLEKIEFLEEVIYDSYMPEEIKQEYLNHKYKVLGMTPTGEYIINIDSENISREDLIELVFNLKDKVFKLEEELKEVKEKIDKED
jgi:hypothetical protein